MRAHKATYPRKAHIERTIAAARASGVDVGGFEVDPDGTIRVLGKQAAVAPPQDAYEAWAAKRAQG